MASGLGDFGFTEALLVDRGMNVGNVGSLLQTNPKVHKINICTAYDHRSTSRSF